MLQWPAVRRSTKGLRHGAWLCALSACVASSASAADPRPLSISDPFDTAGLTWRIERVETGSRPHPGRIYLDDPMRSDAVEEATRSSSSSSDPDSEDRGSNPAWCIMYLALQNTGAVAAEAPQLVPAGTPDVQGIELRLNDASQSQVVASSSDLTRWTRTGRLVEALFANARPIAPGETRRWVVALRVPEPSARERTRLLHVRDTVRSTSVDVQLTPARDARSLALSEAALPKLLQALRHGDVGALLALSKHDGETKLQASDLTLQAQRYARIEELRGDRSLVVDHTQSEIDDTRARLHLQVGACPYRSRSYRRECEQSSIWESFGAGVDVTLGVRGAEWWLDAIQVNLPARFVEERTRTAALLRRFGPLSTIRTLGCDHFLLTTRPDEDGKTQDLLVAGPSHRVLCRYGYNPSVSWDGPGENLPALSDRPCWISVPVHCPLDPKRDAEHNGFAYEHVFWRLPEYTSELRACLLRAPRDLPASGELSFGPPEEHVRGSEPFGSGIKSMTHRGLLSVSECATRLLDLRFQNAVAHYELPADTARPLVVRVRISPQDAHPDALPARLMIDSEPWANIEIDGRPYGTTPLSQGGGVLLPPGKHDLVLRAVTGGTRTMQIDLMPGELLSQDWRWSEAP